MSFEIQLAYHHSNTRAYISPKIKKGSAQLGFEQGSTKSQRRLPHTARLPWMLFWCDIVSFHCCRYFEKKTHIFFIIIVIELIDVGSFMLGGTWEMDARLG
jgi:hypothetical protein